MATVGEIHTITDENKPSKTTNSPYMVFKFVSFYPHRKMDGETVDDDWAGSLELTYKYGPGFAGEFADM